MATHSLAWRIPWIEKPGRLQSMGSQRVLLSCKWHNRMTNAFNFFKKYSCINLKKLCAESVCWEMIKG